MALQQSLTLNNGIILEFSYIRIYNIELNISNVKTIKISVTVHKDEASFNDSKPEVLTLSHSCSSSDYEEYFSEIILNQLDKNIISQSYQYLKDLIYTTAIDV
jgi:hypothetical protein